MPHSKIHPSLVQQLPKPSFGHFMMLRCLIALAHADGVMHHEEKAYIFAIVNRYDMPDEWEKTILEDCKTPQDIGVLFAQINEPSMRVNVLHFARILAFKDGILSPSEDAILKKLHLTTTQNLDMDKIKSEIQIATAVEMDVYELELRERNKMPEESFISWFYYFDKLLLRLGIDLMR
jgi:uncharacterized membrane protein YebE (DUF533 family)